MLAFFEAALAHMSYDAFADLRIYPADNPDTLFVEYRGEAHVFATGRTLHQSYIAQLTMKDGKIALYREYWDPLRVIEAYGGIEVMQAAFAPKG